MSSGPSSSQKGWPISPARLLHSELVESGRSMVHPHHIPMFRFRITVVNPKFTFVNVHRGKQFSRTFDRMFPPFWSQHSGKIAGAHFQHLQTFLQDFFSTDTTLMTISVTILGTLVFHIIFLDFYTHYLSGENHTAAWGHLRVMLSPT